MKKSKKSTSVLIAVLVLLVLSGIALMFYPVFSSWLNERHRSEVQSEYLTTIQEADNSRIEQAFAAAHKYNEDLYQSKFDPLKPRENGYFDILDLAGTGIIGYIEIPSIDVDLPIFHGTSDDVLKIGAGHMPQTSFPIGGASTHAVITAHSGMASSPMFSDITLMKPGDIFYIEVLGEVFTYQVMTEEDINIVSPAQIDDIQILKGQELCTLITCYPFGVNTERYLVRGHRIETPVGDVDPTISAVQEGTEDNESIWRAQWLKSTMIGLLLVILVMILICIFVVINYIFRKKSRQKGRYSGS